jgi:ribonuclease Z
MSNREVIALGTSSQVPTRERSHNAYLLLWDEEGFLFDPGEGAQRQMTLAGVSVSSVHHICITHFHGDHCLGLAGIVQRLSLDGCTHPVHLYYPTSGQPYVDRLCHSAIFHSQAELVYHPVDPTEDIIELGRSGDSGLTACSLAHSVPTIGFRVAEPPGTRFIPEKLQEAGIRGAAVGELKRRGSLQTESRLVRLEEVTVPRPGCSFAFVMDTQPCAGAVALASEADLLLMEATYTSEHRNLADLYRHSTASDAASVAQSATACKLALTHFSQRYSDTGQHLAEAQEIFSNVIILNDFDRVVIPRRR